MLTFAHEKKAAASVRRVRREPLASATGPFWQAHQNQIRHILRSSKVQPKLRIGPPNDVYEQEAGRVADEVMRMPESQHGRAVPFGNSPPTIQRLCTECEEEVQRQPIEEEEEELQAKELQGKSVPRAARAGADGGTVDGALRRDLGASQSEGRPLPGLLRSGFERRFGAPFGDVRVVAGETAARLSDSLQARAFTVGNHIWFGRGEYRPENLSGQRLIAHELAHTLQQRAGTQALHTALRLGSSSDPAEAEADRAADAVMRGRKPGAVARNAPALRRQRRDCSVAPGSQDNQLEVGCGSERYRVTFHLDSRREPETRVDVTPGIDFSNVFFDLEICRGGTRVRVRPSINLTGALRDMVENLVRRDPVLQDITANPELEIEVTISETFSGTIRGGPIVDPQTGDVIGGGVTIEIPLGRPERVDCPRERRFLRLRCERLTTVPGQEAQPAETHGERRHVFLLFPYAESNPVDEVRLGVEGGTPTPVANPDLALQGLAAQGFRVKSLEGYTSPEGPRERRRPGGFQGNDRLGEERAEAARTWLEDNCPDCGAGGITPQGRSELYSPGTTPETEGRELTRIVTPEFVGGDPLRPGTEQEREALTRSSPSQQKAQIFKLLRRARVILERTVVDQPARPAVPPREEAEGLACPSVVRQAVRNFLGLGL